MNTDEYRDSIIAKLREAKEAKGMTYQAIADKTVEHGNAVSLATVKNALGNGSAKLATLFAIADALEVDVLSNEPNAMLVMENQHLKELIKLKDEQIEHRTAEISEYNNQVNSMRKTVYLLQDTIKRKNKLLRTLIIGIVAVGILMMLLLAFDMLTPSLGYFGR